MLTPPGGEFAGICAVRVRERVAVIWSPEVLPLSLVPSPVFLEPVPVASVCEGARVISIPRVTLSAAVLVTRVASEVVFSSE